MGFLSVGDLSSSIRLRFLNAELKQKASTLGNELATGKVSDVSKHLGGNLDRLGTVSRSLRILDAYRVNTSELSVRAAGMQTALQSVQDATEAMGAKSLIAATTSTDASVNTAASAAFESLQIAVSALNSQTAGQSLFAGQATKSQALISASDLLDGLEALTSGATTADQVQSIVENYFSASGGGFETSAYLGSTNLPGSVRISDTETAGFSISAATPELRDVLSGLASAALLSRNILGSDLQEKSNLLSISGEAMLSATDGMVEIRAAIGATEERIEVIEVANSARKYTFEIELGEMTSADGYWTATKLQGVEASLEALYISTSRLSQLSLTGYLR